MSRASTSAALSRTPSSGRSASANAVLPYPAAATTRTLLAGRRILDRPGVIPGAHTRGEINGHELSTHLSRVQSLLRFEHPCQRIRDSERGQLPVPRATCPDGSARSGLESAPARTHGDRVSNRESTPEGGARRVLRCRYRGRPRLSHRTTRSTSTTTTPSGATASATSSWTASLSVSGSSWSRRLQPPRPLLERSLADARARSEAARPPVRLLTLDAEDTLSTFLRDGVPERGGGCGPIGGLIDAATADGVVGTDLR